MAIFSSTDYNAEVLSRATLPNIGSREPKQRSTISIYKVDCCDKVSIHYDKKLAAWITPAITIIPAVQHTGSPVRNVRVRASIWSLISVWTDFTRARGSWM